MIEMVSQSPCVDDSIKTHVGAVIRKFKNTPKSISKPNEIIIASINIRSVKDHLPAMIVDNSDPVVWCMQEISTSYSPPALPRGWKIFLNPRTGGDRHAGGTGFAVDTNRIQATPCHDSGKQAVGCKDTEWIWLRINFHPPLFLASIYSSSIGSSS